MINDNPMEDFGSKALFYLKREANITLLLWITFLLFELAVGML